MRVEVVSIETETTPLDGLLYLPEHGPVIEQGIADANRAIASSGIEDG